MAVDNEAAVLVELERLRGAVNTGFAGVNGRLDGLGQRTTDTEQDVEKLEKRISSLERRVWMVTGVGSVLAVGCSGLLTSMLVH